MKIIFRSVRRDIEDALSKLSNDRLLAIKYIRLSRSEWNEAINEYGVRHLSVVQSRGSFEFEFIPPMTASEMCLRQSPRDVMTLYAYRFTIVHEGSPGDTDRGRA